MIKKLIYFAVLLAPLSVFADPISFEGGQELTPLQTNQLKDDARSASGAYGGNGYGMSDANEAQVFSDVGLDGFSPTGGDQSGYSATKKGDLTFRCEAGERVRLADLQVEVISCTSGIPMVSLCDADGSGFDCSFNKYKVEARLSGDQLVNVDQYSGVPQLFGTYRLKTSCDADFKCTTNYMATYKNSAPNNARDAMVMDDKTREQHTGDDSMFGQYLNLMGHEKMQAMQKEVAAEKHDECYMEQMDQLENNDGNVQVNCDPNDPRSLNFMVEQRPNDNYGEMMCERTETGFCDQPVPIHDYQIKYGEQVCFNQHTKTDGACHVQLGTKEITGTDVIKFTRVPGVRAKAVIKVTSCGTGCTQYEFDNYYEYGNNNYNLHREYVEEYLDMTYFDKSAITKVTFSSPRYDGFMRVWSGNTIVVDPHPNNYGQTNNGSNRSFAEADITTAFKQGMGNESTRMRMSIWITNGEGEYVWRIKVWHKTKGPALGNWADTCANFNNANPNGSSVAGCYQTTTDVCIDSAPRTIDGIVFSPACWKYERKYTCYNAEKTGCDATKLTNNGWVKKSESDYKYPTSVTGQNTSKPWGWNEKWTYTGSEGTDQFGCAAVTNTTQQNDTTGGMVTTTHRWCYTGPVGECMPSPPQTETEIKVCNVVGFECAESEHGLCVKQTQKWECGVKYVCKGSYGNSLEDESAEAEKAMNALGTIMAESEKAKSISEGLAASMTVGADGTIKVFEGKEERCSKLSSKTIDFANLTLIGLGASALTADVGPAALVILNFTQIDRNKRNCCLADPQQVPSYTNFELCDQGDIQLAAARMAGRAHQIIVEGDQFQVDSIEADDDTGADAEYRTETVCVPGATPGTQVCKKYMVSGSCTNPATCGDEIFSEPGTGKEYINAECSEDGGAAQTCKTYVEQLTNNQQTDTDEETYAGAGDTGTSWIKGNMKGCYFYTPGSKGQTPMTINHPGSVSRGDFWADESPFNMPFNCRYSIFDFVEAFQIDHYQSWCVYDSVFAKIVHQQGRQQLAQYAAQPQAGGATKQANFSFYGYPSQGWTAQNLVNDNDVRFWQWNPNCNTANKPENDPSWLYAGTQAATTQGCPVSPDVLVAVCDKSGTCGNLPANPVLDDSKWQIFSLKAEEQHLRAITPQAVLQGGCNASGQCRYNIHAFKKGVGGTVNIPLDMNWQLNSALSGWSRNYINHNSMHFMAYTAPIGEANVPVIKKCIGNALTCKTDGTGPWTTILLDSPTALTGQPIHAAPDVTATGQCSELSGSCSYRLNIKVRLNAKPWHKGVTHESKRYGVRPKVLGSYVTKDRVRWNYNVLTDCSGFSLEEFMALDMNAIDMSEFEAQIAREASQKLEAMTSGGFMTDTTAATQSLLAGSAVPVDQTGSKNFQLSPANGYPGTEVRFRPALGENNTYTVVRDGVEEKYTVSTYTIEWGDGTSTTKSVTNVAPTTHVYGNAKQPPTSNRTLVGTVTWQTNGGRFTDKFTFELWVNALGSEKPGGEVIQGTGGASMSSEANRMQQFGDDLLKLDPNNW